MPPIDPTVSDHLLESPTPSIRYLTLTRLLGLGADEPRVAAEREAVMSSGLVPRILESFDERGARRNEKGFYSPKYRSTHWSMLLLTELAVDGGDGRFRRGAVYMLDAAAERRERRFESGELGWSCLWGNIIRYAVHAGLAGDARLEPYVEYARQDLANGYCRCAYNSGLACAWGVARTLWGVAALPMELRSPALQTAMDDAVLFLTAPGRLAGAAFELEPGGKTHSIWHKLNFPLFYQADILFTLRALAEVGALDLPGAQEALQWLEEQRMGNGRWRGSSPFGARTWALGGATETSRWVTLQAEGLVQEGRAAGKGGG